MTLLQAAFLGILQGLTEFLPVSSSGHLVLAQSLISGFSQPGVLFDAVLHAGTTLAVIIFFWDKIRKLTKNYFWLLLVGTIPAAVAGVLFQSQFEALFSNPRAVGLALILTGAANFLVDRFPKGEKKLNWKNSLLVGLSQAFAIIPGISRSGLTIFTGVWRGIGRGEAATFSFLLSIPAIAGAAGWQILTHTSSLNEINLPNYILGATLAALFGYLSISTVLHFLTTQRFRAFAAYCFLVGGLALWYL